MANQNLQPKSYSNGKKKLNVDSTPERRAAQILRQKCAKRVEELKYTLFRLTDNHMDQVITILKRWAKN